MNQILQFASDVMNRFSDDNSNSGRRRSKAGCPALSPKHLAVCLALATCITTAVGSESVPTNEEWISQIRLLRDNGKFQEALQEIDSYSHHGEKPRDLLLTQAMLLAETGDVVAATALVTDVLSTAPDAIDANLAAAYIHRLAGRPTAALIASQRVLQQVPDHGEAYQHQVRALNDVGSISRALALVEARPALFPQDLHMYLRAQRAAQQVRWGEDEATNPSLHFQSTDRALELLNDIAQELETTEQAGTEGKPLAADSSENWLRNQRDRVLALRQRERMAEAVELFETLTQLDENIPIYTLAAAADAYLYERQPRKAQDLYRRILEQDQFNYNARVALYWALIESEQFSEATAHIDALAAEAPMFRGTTPYWQKLYLDSTAAMARAMANQPAEAQQQLNALLVDAPASALIRRELATVYRWRGWPNLALEEARIALAYEPEEVSGQLLYSTLLYDLEQYSEAAEWIERLHLDYPGNLHVQRQYRTSRDRQRWGISTQVGYGDSSGFREYGSYNWSMQTRLDAPWLNDHFRPYATHYYASARFPEDRGRYERSGIGIEWRKQRHHLYGEAHRSLTGDSESGMTLGYDVNVGDYWSFATRHERSSTEVPLRARSEGLDGDLSEIAARWQADESFNVRLGLSRLSIRDGNTRNAGMFSVERRLFASAYHVTTGALDVYASRASREGGSYFNPVRDASVTIGLTHDWLTWRHYERSFTQNFGVYVGQYQQAGFGSAPIADLSYRHEWHLTRSMRLRYGVGLSTRVYDGNRERHFNGELGLEVLLW